MKNNIGVLVIISDISTFTTKRIRKQLIAILNKTTNFKALGRQANVSEDS